MGQDAEIRDPEIGRAWRRVRIILESLVLVAGLFLYVYHLGGGDGRGQEVDDRVIKANLVGAYEKRIVQRKDAEGYPEIRWGEPHFVAISYKNLTTEQNASGKTVASDLFAAQLNALHSAGYRTVTPQDVIDYYTHKGGLPDKAMMLIIEDGDYQTAKLAEQVLQRNEYQAVLCTYASEIGSGSGAKISGSDLRALDQTKWWKFGTSGYRLAYINVFDRYANAVGRLTAQEFQNMSRFIGDDYSAYLMDYLRDSDRLRVESEAEMTRRIQSDYQQMATVYEKELTYIPLVYVLNSPNTGAFGKNEEVSRVNREMIEKNFSLNFNRMGTALNTLKVSCYDLSRLQVQDYFSTNHLMMRLWDDTGDDVVFSVGDEMEAQRWYVDAGVAEFNARDIVLTTEPRSEARMTVKNLMLDDFELQVTLKGTVVGKQSIYLRSDRNGSVGIQVSVEDNRLFVRNAADRSEVLFRKNLYNLGSGTLTAAEDELAARVALQRVLVKNEPDEQRRKSLQQELNRLLNTRVASSEEETQPLYEMSDRINRRLRLRLLGDRLSIWVDNVQVVDQLQVESSGRGTVVFGAGVSDDIEKVTGRPKSDDVYDAVYSDMTISEVRNTNSYFYRYPMSAGTRIEQSILPMWQRWFNWLKSMLPST